MRRDDDRQGWLFGGGPLDAALRSVPAVSGGPVARALAPPSGVRFGTSSWSFPGWRGLVFDRSAAPGRLASEGVAAYASHPLFGTVGLDRAFYSILGRPEIRSLASLVPSKGPDGFRFVVKAHQSITRPYRHRRDESAIGDGSTGTFGDTVSARAHGDPNPAFLDAELVERTVLAPWCDAAPLALGPIVLQFPPLVFGAHERVACLRSPDAFLERLHRFLAALPSGPLYAVELRNREFLAGGTANPLAASFAALLRDTQVAWGFAVHPSLPPLAVQSESMAANRWPVANQPCLVIRWLLGHGLAYAEAKARYAPFDELVAPDPVTRAEVASLVRVAHAAGRLTWVVANNKAEGSAPLTLVALRTELDGAA